MLMLIFNSSEITYSSDLVRDLLKFFLLAFWGTSLQVGVVPPSVVDEGEGGDDVVTVLRRECL